MATFNFIEQSLFSNINEKSEHSFLSCSEQETELSQSQMQGTSALLFLPTPTPFICQWNTETEKSAQRSPSEPSQQASQALTCVIKYKFFIVFKENCETNIPLTGLYKTSNSSSNNSSKKNMAYHLSFALYKSFRTRIHSYSAWMFM